MGHEFVELSLSGMPERGMPDVVYKSQRFGQVFIQCQLSGDGAGDLGDLNGVSEAVTEMVGNASREDLSLVFQPAKGAGVNHAITVPLKIIAIGMLWFRIATAAALFYAERVGRKHEFSVTERKN
jgi:hypothetical protein